MVSVCRDGESLFFSLKLVCPEGGIGGKAKRGREEQDRRRGGRKRREERNL